MCTHATVRSHHPPGAQQTASTYLNYTWICSHTCMLASIRLHHPTGTGWSTRDTSGFLPHVCMYVCMFLASPSCWRWGNGPGRFWWGYCDGRAQREAPCQGCPASVCMYVFKWDCRDRKRLREHHSRIVLRVCEWINTVYIYIGIQHIHTNDMPTWFSSMAICMVVRIHVV